MGLLVFAIFAAFAEPAELSEPTERPEPADFGVVPENVALIAREVADRPLAERMKRISEPFLGRSYEIDGLGEGIEPDQDPPVRYDAFDCVTFIEEVLALSWAGDPMGAPSYRNALRYEDGKVGYEHRNHFMLAQWIPENIASGFFEDITHTLGETHRIEKEVTQSVWRNWAGTAGFTLPLNELPVGTYGLNVLSLDEAEAAMDKIPAGSLILTVRRPNSWKPIVVSHVGFVIAADGDEPPMIRHATKMSGGSVRDHLLPWYFDHMRWYKRPVEGISVLKPIDQGPRAALVP
jgi:hypothetical protein